MGRRFLYFLLVLLVVAIFLAEDFVFLLIYLFIGLYLVSRWWGARTLRNVTIERNFEPRVFLGEKVGVHLRIQNNGWLPLAWLQIRESLPAGLGTKGPYQHVTTLGSKSKLELEYSVECIKRGYYPLGPLDLFSGDVLGAAPVQQNRLEPCFLTVFPKVTPLNRVRLPSRSPLGTLRHHQPVFEDPSRILGKRDYTAGDSLRRVDWKSSASIGRLQVKLFEPSIALESSIILDLDADSYSIRRRYDVSELAIMAAASLSFSVIGSRQAVGIACNGADPLAAGNPPVPLLPRRGRAQLLRILETLARVQISQTITLVELLLSHMVNLSWGTTLVVISGRVDEHLLESLLNARRSGMNSCLIQCGFTTGYEEIFLKARNFGIPIHQLIDEDDLNFLTF